MYISKKEGETVSTSREKKYGLQEGNNEDFMIK